MVHQRPRTDGVGRPPLCLHGPRRGRCRLLLDAGMASVFHRRHGELDRSRLTTRPGVVLMGRRPRMGFAMHRARREVLLVHLRSLQTLQGHGHWCCRERLADGSFPRCTGKASVREWLLGPHRPNGLDRRRRPGMADVGKSTVLLPEAESRHDLLQWRTGPVGHDRGGLRQSRHEQARAGQEVQGQLCGRPLADESPPFCPRGGYKCQ